MISPLCVIFLSNISSHIKITFFFHRVMGKKLSTSHCITNIFIFLKIGSPHLKQSLELLPLPQLPTPMTACLQCTINTITDFSIGFMKCNHQRTIHLFPFSPKCNHHTQPALGIWYIKIVSFSAHPVYYAWKTH